MPGDAENIIVGAASVRVNGTDVGYTQGGVTCRAAMEFLDIDADQLAGVVKKIPTFERAYLTTTMLEATIANLLIATNQPSTNSTGSSLSFGQAVPAAPEHTLTITGVAPQGGVRTYTFYRAVVSDEVEHLIGARDNVSSVPIGFELLKDPAHDNEFGFFVDV
jgi:hypothetical protein